MTRKEKLDLLESALGNVNFDFCAHFDVTKPNKEIDHFYYLYDQGKITWNEAVSLSESYTENCVSLLVS